MLHPVPKNVIFLRLVSTSAITTHAKGAGPDGASLGADKLADIKEPKEGDGGDTLLLREYDLRLGVS